MVSLSAGVAFLGFAVWSGRERNTRVEIRGGSCALTVAARSAVLFAVSEVGDKTMLATIGPAAHGHAPTVWVGSMLGVVAAETVAVFAGARIGRWVSLHALPAGAAVVFAVMGVALIVRAALP